MVEITRLYSLHMFRSDAKSVFYVYVDVKDEDLFFYKNKKVGNIGLSKAIEQWFKEEGYTDEYRIFVKLVDHWILEDHLTKRLHLTIIMPTTLYMKFKLTWL